MSEQDKTPQTLFQYIMEGYQQNSLIALEAMCKEIEDIFDDEAIAAFCCSVLVSDDRGGSNYIH